MAKMNRTSEIVEEDVNGEEQQIMKQTRKFSIENDINKLFEAIDIRNSRKSIEQDALRKSAMKRPMRIGIGISESVSLKQAFRGLCISQASEIASVKKRLFKPSSFFSAPEAMKKLYQIMESNETGKGNLMEISLVPEMNLVEESNHEIVSSSFNTGFESFEAKEKQSKKMKLPRSMSETPNTNTRLIKRVLLNKHIKKKQLMTTYSTSSSANSKCEEKGEISESSKSSSIGDYSSTTTSNSDESYLSGPSRSGSRPHMSRDVRWEAINRVKKMNHGHNLGLKNFKLIKRLGSGDIGTVYLSELLGTNCLFAIKVMDNDFLSGRRKMIRALTEKEILEMLDHPFLPTLYCNFTSDKYSCLVMEYCPGGDLHVLRQKQPRRSFNEQAARFYIAEILLALEYLHMLGVVYRDLKPENVLVREDGHIMLTDFDLSLRCIVNPTLLKSCSPIITPSKRMFSEANCIGVDPFCLNPSWEVSCFNPKFFSTTLKSRKVKSEIVSQVRPLPELVVEPTDARSNSFVGTHEYLAPEIIKAEGHGSAVDWWTLGIFLYELLYSRTPFKGSGNEDTLVNVVSKCLKFPENPMVSSQARDLMRRLLQKEPENRLGSERGATEIKQHPFFEGLNFALIRCAVPPELPKLVDSGYITGCEGVLENKGSSKCEKECKNTGEDLGFEMF